MLMLVIFLLVMGTIAPVVTEAQTDRPAIVAFCKSVKGKDFYLKIDVVSIERPREGTDATNIFPGPRVSYRWTFDGRRIQASDITKKAPKWLNTVELIFDGKRIQASDAEDFAEEARLEVVRHYRRGTKVTIEKSAVKKDKMEIHLKETGGSKTKVRFKFDKHPEAYNPATVMEMFAFTFAESKEDFAESKEDLAEKTIELIPGMSIEEVVQLKGSPLTKVNLGTKTILSYDDIKLIFQDGSLSDAE